MIRIKKSLDNKNSGGRGSKPNMGTPPLSGMPPSSRSPREKENIVDRMMALSKSENKAPRIVQPESLFADLVKKENEDVPPFFELMKKNEDYPKQQPTLKRVSSLTKSLKSLANIRKQDNARLPPFGVPALPRSPGNQKRSFLVPMPRDISPSWSSGSSVGSPGLFPLSVGSISARSITPIASPVCHNALALCAELDIDTLTLDHHGALKRGIDIEGIAICEKNGVHLNDLQKYKAVRRDIDIKGISICKANGVEIEVLYKMDAIEPHIDISGIAICATMGIDIYTLQDYGFIEPHRSLRSIALLKQQGYTMEDIFMMGPDFDCI